MTDLLPYLVALPLLPGVVLAWWAGRPGGAIARRRAAWVAGLTALACCAGLLALAGPVFDGQVLGWQRDWLPSAGLNLSLRLDGLAWLFALLIAGMGVLVVLYAAWYLGDDDPPGRFFALLMLFMAAMLGVALSGNLLQLAVAWELTSISSFLLVGYWSHRADARAGARMALAVTGGGGLALLAGLLLLGDMAGSFELAEVLARREQVQADPRYPVALVLILLGCFTKSAQWPFHFWLPEAMAAPTPVSAYLHSATMVKAGIFLVARLHPVLAGSELFTTLVAGVGLVTLAFAAYVAVFRHDLKGLLAYSTISHLGLIMFLLGLQSPLAAVAAMFHLLNHATFKASLFMTAGIIDHETGTRDMRRLGGLFSLMPWTGTLAIVAAASMAGVPLVNGFLSKEMFFDEALRAGGGAWGWTVPVLATFAGVCAVAYSLRFVHDSFFNGPPRDLPNAHPHEPPWPMKLPVGLLVVACLVVGMLPAATVGPLVRVAAGAVLVDTPLPDYHLALWHGLNWPLLMSMVALLGGVAMYLALQRRWNLHLHHPRGVTGRLLFTRAVDGAFAGARRITRALATGSQQRNLALMVGSAVLLAAWPLWQSPTPLAAGTRALQPASPLAWALWALLLAAGGALVLLHHHRLVAVVLAGAIGLVTAVTFEGLSAPDLALTQLSVEVVSTVLLLMALALLPATSPRESSAGRRWRDGLLAGAAGLGVSLLAWWTLTRDHDSIAWYFLEQSLPAGGGTNAVNVILVDFRGYDTFGEITVLGVAAIGVLALLDGWRARRPGHDADGRAWSFAQPSLLLRLAARLVLPLALAVSLYIFWRGHNLPGGGFIAGLVTAAALVLQYMALGHQTVETVMRAGQGRRFTRWIAGGLGLAALTGVGAFAFGRPFLTSAHGHPHLPLLGELPLASAALFDLGVYIVVVGATLMMFSVLGAVTEDRLAESAEGRPA
ncbi:monovalent cation/H+ antiporter subunit A [Aquabacterium sp. J223]|uniref:monovalent cation/H+ antiporter subunit A n=1 Tax=Aquabacterium sp. J223 TaxID=2898431 RepID=UPI0021AD68CE|nr:monovalent cation/H+ antiporter subunit A [Aquabacterium sp. J223]UUX94915.1 monovalent cation/H+ antiporter subunit A [Aquabacterium sp. J223]